MAAWKCAAGQLLLGENRGRQNMLLANRWIQRGVCCGGAGLRRLLLVVAGLVLLGGSSGCIISHKSYVEPDRLNKGLILILPGIEGESMLNHMIADGLKDAGLPDAIDIYDWTGTRFFMIGGVTRYERNMRQAAMIAHRLTEYQRGYPGRPVHLIGHSAGGGIAVMVLEQMSRNRPITAAILLAPAISPSHNLVEAMRRTKFGIYNFWSPGDFAWLGIGTTTFGTVDREHGPAAGMIGFRVPEHLSPADARLYQTRLHQVHQQADMVKEGQTIAPHIGWSSQWFVRDWLGKIILAHEAGRTPELN